MERIVNGAIYFYIFICISLLVFNLVYILSSSYLKKSQRRRAAIWRRELNSVLKNINQGYDVQEDHKIRLKQKLRWTEELIAYNEAIQQISLRYEDSMKFYFDNCRDVFQILAFDYKKRGAMERGFIAYLISVYYKDLFYKQDILAEILLTYLEDSTVYCRENVLQALYVMGNAAAVERAFALFSEQGWYHYPRLISDGMNLFTGNKESLIRRLWSHMEGWNEELIVALIQFASNVSGEFCEDFLLTLKDYKTPLEIRFALLRYFQRWNYEPAREFIIKSVLENGENYDGLSIVASDVAAQYPGDDTKQALKKAVCSQDWYIRRNAAASLISLGISEEEIYEMRRNGDKYAAEMLNYMIESENKKVVSI